MDVSWTKCLWGQAISLKWQRQTTVAGLASNLFASYNLPLPEGNRGYVSMATPPHDAVSMSHVVNYHAQTITARFHAQTGTSINLSAPYYSLPGTNGVRVRVTGS
eukprot:323651-Chlamydomonas_euryale.AAC.1